ncbi:MAG: right-handed parallel beta-helix repeat-containing protein [Deltaproteobacteria bacterium]|nr:right-handed parallel beta-helix repeat-containing protein [Deltaproteobacteria bacterium]
MNSGQATAAIATLMSALTLAVGCGAGEPTSPDALPAEADGGAAGDAAASCGPGLRRRTDRSCVPVGPRECVDGFEADPSGWGCREIRPEVTCPAATMPVLGQRQCQPVGWRGCPAGFVPATDGWGCSPLLPAAPCTGATMEVIGRDTCQAIGDCSAPLPADADHFVNASLEPGQEDATHHRSIGAALRAASAGDLIVVEAGRYSESLAVSKAIRLVGRCPAQVLLEGTAERAPGLLVRGAVRVEVSGLQIRGHKLLGVAANEGATLVLDRCLVWENTEAGVMVSDGTLRMVDSAIRANRGGTVGDGQGVQAESNSSVELERVAIAGNVGWGFVAAGGSTGMIRRSFIGRTGMVGTLGIGVTAQAATVKVEECVIDSNAGIGAYAHDFGELEISHSIIQRTAPGEDPNSGIGIQVFDGSAVRFSGGALVDNHRTGAAVSGAGSLLHLEDALLATRAGGSFAADLRLLDVKQGGAVEVVRAATVGTMTSGLSVVGAGSGATVSESLLMFQGPDLAATETAVGINVQDGGSLWLKGSSLVGARSRSLMVYGSTATVEGTLILGNQGASGGWGVDVNEAGTLSASRLAVALGRQQGLVFVGEGTRGTLSDVVIHDIVDDAEVPAFGLAVVAGAQVVLESVSAFRVQGDGLVASGAGTLVRAASSVVRSGLPTPYEGVAAFILDGARFEASDCALLEALGGGVCVADEGSAAVLERSSVRSTARIAGREDFGHGAFAFASGSLTLLESEVEGSEGIGVVFDHATGSVRRTLIANNSIGAHVQAGVTLAVDSSAESPLPLQVIVDTETVFEGNGMKLGSGVVPLPSLPSLEF